MDLTDHLFIDNVLLIGRGLPFIQNVDASSDSLWLGPEQLVHLKTKEGNIMASIQNQSSHDFGCVSAQSIQIAPDIFHWNQGSLFRRGIQIEVANPHPQANIKVTQYALNQEVQQWEQLSGFKLNQAKVFTGEAIPTPLSISADWVVPSENLQYSERGHLALSATVEGKSQFLSIGIDQPVSVDEPIPMHKELWKVFPNPAQDRAYFSTLQAPQITEMGIFHMFGKQVFRTSFTGNTIEVQTSDLASGIYLASFKTQAAVHSCKFVVFR
jgi:Secretion system C-terminal sorting domain